jgi:hypothetical protein
MTTWRNIFIGRIVMYVGHFVIIMIAVVVWLIAILHLGVALVLTILADKLWPNASMGNCWSLAGPKWWHNRKHSYLVVRIAPDAPIPHSIWALELPADTKLLQTFPLKRKKGWRAVLSSPYFPFRVIDHEPTAVLERHKTERKASTNKRV